MSQNWCAARLDRFWRDVHGGLTAFTAVTFLLMFGAAGMGVDFIRQETLRSELQGALDRGVLAAAALTQTGEGKIVVAEYLRSASGFDNSLDVDVQIFGHHNLAFSMSKYLSWNAGSPSSYTA